jgi:Rad3-related DNA helicase
VFSERRSIMQHHSDAKLRVLEHFPKEYPKPRPGQVDASRTIEELQKSVTFEAPTGVGKTLIGISFLRALAARGEKPLFYVVPNKNLVEQVKKLHPEVTVVFGRNEYPCLYYEEPKEELTPTRVAELFGVPENLKADQIPCSFLQDCPHRVSLETGETHEPGAARCPYLDQMWQARQAKIVVATMAFYLFNQLYARSFARPAGLVVDEAHRIANVVRNCLSYEITDYHLRRSIELLEEVGIEEAKQLTLFLRTLIRIVKSRPEKTPSILEPHEIEKLLSVLTAIDPDEFKGKVGKAVKTGKIDPKGEREVLKHLETLGYELNRYVRSLVYSLETEERKPLNYTFAYYVKELAEGKRVQYRLVVKNYYVAPLVRKILSPLTVAYSATVGDPDIFKFETGIRSPVYELPSDFPAENTRLFLPEDTPNLAMKERRRQDLTRVLRRIAKACRRFAKNGIRSLVVVVSEHERQKFLMLSQEEGVNVISYGNGVPAKDVATRFRQGEGDVLVGTVANYGEGFDLPKGIAPVIFFLRPGYPSPHDPQSQFEERRFGSQRWQLWNWRVMIEALQVRGRNVRSAKDLGVTFFISQQFRRFLYGSLPKWLEPAYRGQMRFDACVEETLKLLK